MSRSAAVHLGVPDSPLPDPQSMVARTVRRLASLSLAAIDGEYLGSEQELIEWMEVSRPTFRQATKILENDGLLSIRRGVRGGFYAARPEAQDVVRAPAQWLGLRKATLAQSAELLALIVPDAAAAAARCIDDALVAELRALREEITGRLAGDETRLQAVAFDTKLEHTIVEMCGNPFFTLVNDIAYAFGIMQRSTSFYPTADGRRTWLQIQRSLCDAILNGDDEAARLIARQRSELSRRWLAAEGQN